jgi:hypothetical protein
VLAAPSAQTATRPLFAACSDEARVFADEARTRTPDYRPSATPASSRASSSSPTRCDSGNGAKGCRTMSLAMTPPSRILSGLPVLFARGRPSEAGRPSVRTASRLGTSAGLPGWSSTCLSRRSHLFGARCVGPLVAIRRASSQVSSLAAARVPRLAVVLPASLMRLFQMHHLARLSCGLFRLV